jgi:hypothetical protein
MSVVRACKSYATTWALTVIVSVPIYLLSVAPIAQAFGHSGRGGWFEVPGWIGVYGAPYGWVVAHSPEPLQQLNQDYVRWWCKKVNPAVARDYGF